MSVSVEDKTVIRELAEKIFSYSKEPIMEERRHLSCTINDLKGERPLVITSPEGAWREILPKEKIVCTDPVLRGWEHSMRENIFHFEEIQDDWFFDASFDIPWQISYGGYGIDIKEDHSEDDTGAYAIDAPVTDIDAALETLHFRSLSVDREKTEALFSLANEIFGDILDVRIKGVYWWTTGLTWEAIKLVGLQEFMMKMYDDADGIHRLMSFLRDDMLQFVDWFEKENLLSANCADSLVGSGGTGVVSELAPYSSDRPFVGLQDIWGFSESQETVGVSPDMFEKFILPYQKPLFEKFGLLYYGCCEPLDKRFKYLKDIKNLRALSVSPWCNQEALLADAGNNYVYNRKTNPAFVLTKDWEGAVREDIRKTLDIFKGQSLQFILKDTHTINNDPGRLSRWVSIVREEIKKS